MCGWTSADNGHGGVAGSGCRLLEVGIFQGCGNTWHEHVEKTSWIHRPLHWTAQPNGAGPQVRAVRHKLHLKTTQMKYLRWMICWMYWAFDCTHQKLKYLTSVAWRLKLIKCIWMHLNLSANKVRKRSHYFPENILCQLVVYFAVCCFIISVKRSCGVYTGL